MCSHIQNTAALSQTSNVSQNYGGREPYIFEYGRSTMLNIILGLELQDRRAPNLPALGL